MFKVGDKVIAIKDLSYGDNAAIDSGTKGEIINTDVVDEKEIYQVKWEVVPITSVWMYGDWEMEIIKKRIFNPVGKRNV